MQAWEFKADLPVFAAAWGQRASKRVFFEESQKLFKRLKKYYISPVYIARPMLLYVWACACVFARSLAKAVSQKEDTVEKKKERKEGEHSLMEVLHEVGAERAPPPAGDAHTGLPTWVVSLLWWAVAKQLIIVMFAE